MTTPGPWVAVDGGCIKGGEYHEYANGKAQPQVALATGGEHIDAAERDANARLIAAAPDLLAACKAGLDALVSVIRSEFETFRNHYPEDADPAVHQLRAAIAKARGEATP